MVSETLTLKETSILSGAPEKSIRHALHARVAWAGRVHRRRLFGPREVLYFHIIEELPAGIGLDKTLRKDLFDILVKEKARAGCWRREAHGLVLEGDVRLVLPTDEIEKRVKDRVCTFLRGKSRLVRRPEILGGEPVFEGTRISVRFVGERARKGEPVQELLEEYPALEAEDIEFAKMYTALGRPPGRPKKKLKYVRGGG